MNGLKALIEPSWLEAHRDDPDVCLVEIAGLGQENMQAYAHGHVPGAHGWKWKDMLWDPLKRDFPTPEDFARRLGAAGIGNDTTVVFYGEGEQFGFYAWWVFRYCGHANVHVLDGARYRWLAELRPLDTETPPKRRALNYKAMARIDRMRISRDDVISSLGQENVLILDARSPDEYSGLRVGVPGGPDIGAERYGRIPGALHLHYSDLLNADKSFRTLDEIRRILAMRGVTDDHEVIVYCRLSHRATVVYFALTELLGMDRVRVYDGSWTEWGNLVGVPIEL
ncbi:MAG: sulfurtransferase [Burkholderiales bacterium]|nr:sulfurtransferase [Burkholderiales bacterium]